MFQAPDSDVIFHAILVMKPIHRLEKAEAMSAAFENIRKHYSV
jgi:hypothetical protein